MQETDTGIVFTACGQQNGGKKLAQNIDMDIENKWNENDTSNGKQLQNVWNENGTEYSLKTKARC